MRNIVITFGCFLVCFSLQARKQQLNILTSDNLSWYDNPIYQIIFSWLIILTLIIIVFLLCNFLKTRRMKLGEKSEYLEPDSNLDWSNHSNRNISSDATPDDRIKSLVYIKLDEIIKEAETSNNTNLLIELIDKRIRISKKQPQDDKGATPKDGDTDKSIKVDNHVEETKVQHKNIIYVQSLGNGNLGRGSDEMGGLSVYQIEIDTSGTTGKYTVCDDLEKKKKFAEHSANYLKDCKINYHGTSDIRTIKWGTVHKEDGVWKIDSKAEIELI
ncbi:MAG: hypothetical protein LKF31_08270 [Muribaculaceae bacterium]|jgi:hypothetical protein|nr:hypothetical protein [Muribaculaceae bacterium]